MSSAERSREDREDRAFEWWTGLQEDRGGRARLRRAASIVDMMLLPQTAALHIRLWGRSKDFSAAALERTALVAGVLATVRNDAPDKGFAQELGQSNPGGTPVLSAVRAMRLRRARTPDEALDSFRRALALVKETADVRDLARYLIAWCDESGSPRTRADAARIRFAFAYHGASLAAPDADKTETNDLPEETDA